MKKLVVILSLCMMQGLFPTNNHIEGNDTWGRMICLRTRSTAAVCEESLRAISNLVIDRNNGECTPDDFKHNYERLVAEYKICGVCDERDLDDVLFDSNFSKKKHKNLKKPKEWARNILLSLKEPVPYSEYMVERCMPCAQCISWYGTFLEIVQKRLSGKETKEEREQNTATLKYITNNFDAICRGYIATPVEEGNKSSYFETFKKKNNIDFMMISKAISILQEEIYGSAEKNS